MKLNELIDLTNRTDDQHGNDTVTSTIVIDTPHWSGLRLKITTREDEQSGRQGMFWEGRFPKETMMVIQEQLLD